MEREGHLSEKEKSLYAHYEWSVGYAQKCVSEVKGDDRFISDVIPSENCLIRHEFEDMMKLIFARKIVNLPALDEIEWSDSRCVRFISEGPETC
jgi:hypothetical protein